MARQKLLFCIVLVVAVLLPSLSYAQVVNSDFSASDTGWTGVAPDITDNNLFTVRQLTSP